MPSALLALRLRSRFGCQEQAGIGHWGRSLNMKTYLLIFLSVILAPSLRAQSLEDRVSEMERQLGNTEPTAEQQKQMKKDLEEIKAMGLIDGAITEFKKKHPKAEIAEVSAAYFPNRETVPISIIYSDPTAKSAQQELVFHKEESGWKIATWRNPSVLETK